MAAKNYVVRLLIKKDGYKSKTMKGIVVADSPKKASEKAISNFLEIHRQKSAIELDESNVFVKQCTVWNDFVFSKQS